MKRSLICFPLLLTLFYVEFAGAADGDWRLRKDKDDIQVYTKEIEGSPHDAVMAVTVMQNVRLSSMVALIEDLEACPDWADRCAESYVYRRLSETEAYVYTHNAMPFPVKDRDVLAHVTWTQNPESYEVVMTSMATTGIMEEVKGRLRLVQAKANWRFKPLPGGGVEVSNEAHINPGSSLPGWITNMLLVDTPHNTMKSFAAEVVKPKYRDAEIGFISEPVVEIKQAVNAQ